MPNIQIALGTDMRYLEQTLIAMLSVLRSTPAPITVHLFGLKLSDGALQRFETAARSCGADPIHHRITGDMSARWCTTGYDYISPAAIASLYVPSVVGTGRCLFLDSDTMCFADIRALCEADILGRPIAVVTDYHWLKDHINNPSALSNTKYVMTPRPHWEIFNSGVVLFDCDLINADAEFRHFLETHLVDSGDQHHLNQTFKGCPAFLHPSWNCHSGLPGHYIYVQRHMIPQEFHVSQIPAKIWHFRGRCKPWNTEDTPPLGADGAPLPDSLIPADDDPVLDEVEPADPQAWNHAVGIRHVQYRRAAARLLAEALPETA